jgi:hypothetical protein
MQRPNKGFYYPLCPKFMELSPYWAMDKQAQEQAAQCSEGRQLL